MPDTGLPPELGDWKSLDELHRLQSARLSEVFHRARTAPFYRARLPELEPAPDAWHSLPVTTKADLRAAYPFGMLAVDREQLATYHESSGTTGEPTSSYLTDGDWDDIASRYARTGIDLGRGETVLVNTPYSMLTTAHQMHRAARLRGALVVPAGNRTWNMPHARIVRMLRDLPISVVWSVPTNTLLVAAAARLLGYDPGSDFPTLRAFLVAGEALSEARRARISELWGGKAVLQDYGSTETGSLAGECSHGRMHLWADRLYCEVVDPVTGESARYGVGQLAITPLYRQAMPLVRYLLEDTVEVARTPCDCGWALPVVRVLGRSGTRIEVQGRPLFPSELEAAVYSLPMQYGVLFWRARHDPHSLEVEVEAEPSWARAAAAGLTDEIHHRLGISAKVRSVAPGTIVSQDHLREATITLKPSYLFPAHEGWPADYRW
ncbi:phenylacetate--CoA ligase family protein [Haliangium sp.]|uniref:phenylacetate--CoA ligase family protein n=1 Tax=Haliangium sp. TaxID=2663208 RepID=UPI003D0D8D5B